MCIYIGIHIALHDIILKYEMIFIDINIVLSTIY